MEMQYNRIKKTDRTLQWNSRRIIFVWEIIVFPKDILDPKLVDWIIAKVIKIDCKTAPWRQLISMNWYILQGWCISVKQIWYETTKGQILSIKERVEWLSIFLKRNRRASEESIHFHSIYASALTAVATVVVLRTAALATKYLRKFLIFPLHCTLIFGTHDRTINRSLSAFHVLRSAKYSANFFLLVLSLTK